VNLCETANVSFFTREPRRYKRAHDLERELNSNYTCAQAQYVAIVMFA
jgi:hypothetical protein